MQVVGKMRLQHSSAGISNKLVKNHALLLPLCWLVSPLSKAVESAAGDAQHAAHGSNLEFA